MKLKNCRRTAEEWRVFVRHRGECGAWTNWVVSFLPRSLFEVRRGLGKVDGLSRIAQVNLSQVLNLDRFGHIY